MRGAVVAAAQQVDEDLWQFPDREQWYHAKWCAADQPDWNPARFVRSTQLAPGVRCVEHGGLPAGRRRGLGARRGTLRPPPLASTPGRVRSRSAPRGQRPHTAVGYVAKTSCRRPLSKTPLNPPHLCSFSFLSSPGREVVLEVEISREKVPLRNAYKHAGQRASVRVNSGAAAEVLPATAPFPQVSARRACLPLGWQLG